MKRPLAALFVLLALLSDPSILAPQDTPVGPLQGRGGGQGRGPARDPREQPAGTAVIRGRIIAADTGAPIRRAQVRATSGGGQGRLAGTDAQGRFEFRDLPAGRWELAASKAGFVTLRFGQRRPFEAGRPIELAEAQVVERADFTLPRGAAITGRVFDEFGDPVAGARVQVLRNQLVQGTRRLTPTGAADQSDDTGAFRVFGLMPGDYYVSATLRALPVDDPNDRAAYAPTYFPGTGSVSDAQRITLALAEEAGNINFALLPVRTVRVSGTAMDSMGNPLANGTLMLMPADVTGGVTAAFGGFGGFGGGTRIRPDGSFTITNVAPGSYTLTATAGMRPRDPDLEMASLSLAVGAEDLTGLTLVTSRGATLTGTIVAAQGGAARLAMNGLQVSAPPLQPQPGFGFGQGARPGRVESDGTFTLTNLFGPRLIRINGLAQDWMLKAVMVGGDDVTDTPLEFGPNGEVRGVQIIVTDRVAEVTGTAAGGDGKPARDYTVVIFPDDDSKWTASSRYIQSARPDQQGLFKIRALPPNGRYLAVAVDYLEVGEANDAEFLELVKDRATRFALGDGESKAIDLKLVQR